MLRQILSRVRRVQSQVRQMAGRCVGLRAMHESEEGTMAQVTVIAVMGFTVLVGMVGNVGRIVQKKVAVQNAADSAAYSAALWQARSMNAVTAINHMMGEVTSICVLHEAFGGPQLDDGVPEDSKEFKDLNDRIKSPRNQPNLVGIILPEAPQLNQIDARIVDMVQRIVTNDDGRTFSGATIYDSRVTLKQLVAFLQDVKLAGNVLIAAGHVPFLQFLIPIGVGMHAVATPLLIKCGVEAGMLMVVEVAAKLFVIPKKLLERQLLPLLAKYPEALMKSGSPLGSSISSTVQELETQLKVQGNVFPSPQQIRLPLVAEAEPKFGGGGEIPSKSVDSDWPGPIQGLFDTINTIDDLVGWINDVADLIPGASTVTGWFAPNPPPRSGDGSKENPSRKTVQQISADWKTEETTQWVRASYPWVDSMRAPIISGMKSPAVLMLSKAGVWYGHWTNRFTLAKSHSYRSGRPLAKLAGPQEKMKMFVMRDMQPDRKGRESWTTDSPEAERLFTVMGFTTHQADALFSPVIFGGASHAQVAYAQAMYYNANPQEPGNSGATQPRVGWDTLNWMPPVNVPEYGNVPTERGSLWPPWSIFERTKQSNTPQIKLNWQAKLVPVTRRRLSQAAGGSSYKGNIREWIGKGLQNTRQLDTH